MNTVKKGLARREARLKQRSGPSASNIDEGMAEFSLQDGTHIDLSRRQVRKNEKVIHLTPAEGRLLRVLIENPGRVYSHRELVLLVQGYDTSQREAPEILRPLVSRLRHKLETFPTLSDQIVSVRGTGYLYEGEK
jgi:DNA-binding response OmpR family regulator